MVPQLLNSDDFAVCSTGGSGRSASDCISWTSEAVHARLLRLSQSGQLHRGHARKSSYFGSSQCQSASFSFSLLSSKCEYCRWSLYVKMRYVFIKEISNSQETYQAGVLGNNYEHNRRIHGPVHWYLQIVNCLT